MGLDFSQKVAKYAFVVAQIMNNGPIQTQNVSKEALLENLHYKNQDIFYMSEVELMRYYC